MMQTLKTRVERAIEEYIKNKENFVSSGACPDFQSYKQVTGNIQGAKDALSLFGQIYADIIRADGDYDGPYDNEDE